ncbi:oligosaccharide flippase family protein [Methylobacterium sp. D53M]
MAELREGPEATAPPAFSKRRSLAWMGFCQGGLFLAQFGTSLALARLLTPHETGIFSLAAAIAGLLSTLRSCGLSSYIVRAERVDAALLASVFTVNLMLSGAAALLILAFSVFGSVLLGEPEVQRALAVLAVVPLVGALEFRPAAMIERHGNFRGVALVNMLRGLVASGAMLALALLGFSYMSQAYGQAAGAVAAALAANGLGLRYVSLRLGLAGWREILTYGGRLFAIAGVAGIAGRMGDLVLGRMLGLSALGLYSRAASLNTLMWDHLHVVITRITFVDLANQQRNGQSLRTCYLHTLRMITVLLWPAFAGAAVLAGPIVRVLLGPGWEGAALPFCLLSLAAIVLTSLSMTWEVFLIRDQTALQARFEFLRHGAGLVMFSIGCLFGLGGAGAARIGEAFLAVGLYRPHLERMTDTFRRDYAPIYLHAATLTAIAVAPAILVMSAWGWSAETPLPSLAAAIAAGIAGWVCGLWYLDHPLVAEARLLLAHMRPARPATTVSDL